MILIEATAETERSDMKRAGEILRDLLPSLEPRLRKELEEVLEPNGDMKPLGEFARKEQHYQQSERNNHATRKEANPRSSRGNIVELSKFRPKR